MEPLQKPDNSAGKTKSPMYWIIVFAIVSVSLLIYMFAGSNMLTKEITSQQFENDFLLKHKVARLEIVNNELVEVYLVQNASKFKQMPDYFFRIGSVDSFERRMDELQKSFISSQLVPVKFVKRSNWMMDSLMWILPLVFIFFIGRNILNRAVVGNESNRNIINFGKSSAHLIDEKKDLPTFKDVAGYEEAKLEIMEIVDFLKSPEHFTALGAKIPKGVLLAGPPGTGKTLLAKAVAGEAGVPFFSLSGSEFVEMFVGVGASRVRDLFKNAKSKAPCIVFIDELDTVGKSRERASAFQANDERESTLNQLLAEMDGFDSDTRIIVLAATNRPDTLDSALVRAGRFDRHIYLELPNRNERSEIFKVHMQPLKVNNEIVTAEYLSSQTPGFSGADIANVCNEAALLAARRKKKMIDMFDFTDAIEKIVGGLEKKSTMISSREKEIIAWHEAGHAVISWMLPSVDPLIKLSVIPRGKSLGSTWYLPEERRIITKSEFEDGICAALGGRAAEELKFNELSSGAMDDLEKVTTTAYNMVTKFGFNAIVGHVSFNNSAGLNENSMQRPFSEATARVIDKEAHTIIQMAYNKTKNIISDNYDKLEKLAKELLEKETLNEKEIISVLGTRPSRVKETEKILVT
ncbi:MAG: ATP-dependent zinc metalloprotease FtsH [Bacteroidia bacterium]